MYTSFKKKNIYCMYHINYLSIFVCLG
ncbi:hypothetical protein ACJIZ3_000853 [Penstemon smallii]|uniref:Uncharacterized protein n=1 Tax=Penstemon smallii TaxID=265156 RepID=A0ABD3U373_9LAMI